MWSTIDNVAQSQSVSLIPENQRFQELVEGCNVESYLYPISFSPFRHQQDVLPRFYWFNYATYLVVLGFRWFDLRHTPCLCLADASATSTTLRNGLLEALLHDQIDFFAHKIECDFQIQLSKISPSIPTNVAGRCTCTQPPRTNDFPTSRALIGSYPGHRLSSQSFRDPLMTLGRYLGLSTLMSSMS